VTGLPSAPSVPFGMSMPNVRGLSKVLIALPWLSVTLNCAKPAVTKVPASGATPLSTPALAAGTCTVAAKPPGKAESDSVLAFAKYVLATVSGPGAAGSPVEVFPMVPAGKATLAVPIVSVWPSAFRLPPSARAFRQGDGERVGDDSSADSVHDLQLLARVLQFLHRLRRDHGESVVPHLDVLLQAGGVSRQYLSRPANPDAASGQFVGPGLRLARVRVWSGRRVIRVKRISASGPPCMLQARLED
jgi:hypothetical protein